MDFFQHQYIKDNDEDGRPPKRQKTQFELDSVTILRENLVIQRPSDEVSAAINYLRLQGIHVHLRFELSDVGSKDANVASPYALIISTRPSTKTESFSITFSLGSNVISSRLATILNTRDSSWSNPNIEDAIWLHADAELDADNDMATLTLSFQVKWNTSTTTYPPQLSPYLKKFRKDMLAVAFPAMFGGADEKQENSCSPQVFYDAAHVPHINDTPSENILIKHLTTKLYPFQRRAVKWMLKREGIQWGQDVKGGTVIKDVGFDHFDAPSSFIETKDADDRIFYISPLLSKATKNIEIFKMLEQNFRGGILSEEMGLGKTVELLALFSLHRQPPCPMEAFDNYLGEQVKTAPATLIVAPSSLKDQWLSELKKHAPGLRVMLYTGLSQSAREEENKADALIAKLASHDVVVTTYNVLTSELYYALGEPNRARRVPRKYHRPRSPLTQLRWWRVCLDEAQMIESGVSKAATLARLIPRVNAWGVTGTPVKDNVEG